MKLLKQHISIGLTIVFLTVQFITSIHYVWVTHLPVSKLKVHQEQITPTSLKIGHHCDHLHLKHHELFFVENEMDVGFKNLSFVYQNSYYLDSPKQEWKFIFYSRGPPQKQWIRSMNEIYAYKVG